MDVSSAQNNQPTFSTHGFPHTRLRLRILALFESDFLGQILSWGTTSFKHGHQDIELVRHSAGNEWMTLLIDEMETASLRLMLIGHL
jgi:hypothetical protein